jgi:hypothetical protein
MPQKASTCQANKLHFVVRFDCIMLKPLAKNFCLVMSRKSRRAAAKTAALAMIREDSQIWRSADAI